MVRTRGYAQLTNRDPLYNMDIEKMNNSSIRYSLLVNVCAPGSILSFKKKFEKSKSLLYRFGINKRKNKLHANLKKEGYVDTSNNGTRIIIFKWKQQQKQHSTQNH